MDNDPHTMPHKKGKKKGIRVSVQPAGGKIKSIKVKIKVKMHGHKEPDADDK